MSEVTEVEGKKNVQDTASADDKRDMFMQIIQMTFTSHEAAYDFYNSYARDNGFSIRKNRVRQGKRDSMLLTEEGHSRRLRPQTRCHCETHLNVKLDQKRGVWYVDSFEDKHSHILAGPDEVPFLWSHRKIKEYQRAEILSMGAAGIRIHDMMDSFISKHVWYGGVGFTRREIYNLCAREKRKLLSKGDAATVIGIMVSRKQRDPSFFFEYKLEKEGHMNRMFWCDSQSPHDYEDFGDVLVFDSTYKMNRYDGEMTLVDMILHYENAVVRIRENEARDDCTASQSLPVPVTSSRELEIAASHVFTPANFYMLQVDLRRIGGMEIVEIKLEDGSQQYIVAWKNNRKSRFWVESTLQ
nr:protein FAR1-RELATED SEQUENCE 5-like [Aegilops tauschii subsp. strangulata]